MRGRGIGVKYTTARCGRRVTFIYTARQGQKLGATGNVLERPMRRVYLDKERKGCAICEKCGRVQRIHMAETAREQAITIKCKCRHTFSVRIDQRQHYRKEVSLPGTFERVHPGNTEKGRVVVQDISQTGVGFLTYTKQKVNVNDVLKLKFTLDDPHSSTIDVRGSVKIVKDQYVGMELDRSNEHIQKTLGFYLMQDGGNRKERHGGDRSEVDTARRLLEPQEDWNPFRLPLGRGEDAVGFRGDLRALSGASLLRVLADERKTGVLHLVRSDTRGAICFSKGDIIAVSGDGWHRLGEILVEKKAITREVLDHGLALARSSGKRLGEILLGSRFVTEKTLREIMHHHIRRSVQDLVDWSEGHFEYQDCAVDLPATGVTPAVPGDLQHGPRRKPQKREYSRLPVAWPVSILTMAGPISGEIRNVSLSGALVYCRQLPDPQHFHRLSVEIKKYAHTMLLTIEMIRLDVVYVDYRGPIYSIGTRFVEIDENDLEFLSTRVLR